MKKLISLCVVVFCFVYTHNSVLATTSENSADSGFSNKNTYMTLDKVQGSESASATPVLDNTIAYSLPYPGILVDNSFYFLKRLRDRILEAFMSDPIKKTDFYILQSDKYLAMALEYQQKNNWKYALVTVNDSTTAMQKASMQLQSYRSNGGNIPGYIGEKIQNSIMKHNEILGDFISQAPPEMQADFRQSLELFKGMLSH